MTIWDSFAAQLKAMNAARHLRRSPNRPGRHHPFQMAGAIGGCPEHARTAICRPATSAGVDRDKPVVRSDTEDIRPESHSPRCLIETFLVDGTVGL